jgi:hypothetical protein
MHKARQLGLVLAALLLIVPVSASSPPRQSVPAAGSTRRLVGTWQLVSYLRNGQPIREVGEKPVGLIYYDGTGHMAAQIMPDRARPGWALGGELTPDDAKAAIVGYTAYFGTYTVDERAFTITHHRTGKLNSRAAVDLIRRYEFLTDDRIVLTPAETPTDRLIWDRVK